MIETGLPVTNWVMQWRTAGEPYTEEALIKVHEIRLADLLTGRRSDGSGRFRPSMIGNPCQRAQVFSYLGYEQIDSVPEYKEMAHVGSELHYGWQEQGLSAGWLIDAEVEVDLPQWRLRGQMDGLCKDNSVFELKTLGHAKYWGKKNGTIAVEKWTNPRPEDVRQVHAYMYALGLSQASIVYADRDSNDFREFRVPFDEMLFQGMDSFISKMIRYVDLGQLPPILDTCEEAMDELAARGPFDSLSKGTSSRTFNYCNYRHICGSAS